MNNRQIPAPIYIQQLNVAKFRPASITLAATPAKMQACFTLLKMAGAKYFALFGGAVRDADYAARHRLSVTIKDYDLRIWLPEENYEALLHRLLFNLKTLSKQQIETVLSPGTNKERYSLFHEGVELDISVRPIPDKYKNLSVPPQAVAEDRASDADMGISAVAIDSEGTAWALPEYIIDQENRLLTAYATNNLVRRAAYIERMQAKFPQHVLVVHDALEKEEPEKKVSSLSRFFKRKQSIPAQTCENTNNNTDKNKPN